MIAELSALALVITGADGSFQVMVGSDERAYRHAFGAFVEAWGEDCVWYDNDAKLLGSDGGVTLSRWRARVLAGDAPIALVVQRDRQVVGLYLVADADMAERAAAALACDDVSFATVPVTSMPPVDPEKDSLPLTATIRTRSGKPRPRGPRPPLSDEFCPRCDDHPLHIEPLFDGIDGDGRRICIACAKLATLRQAADRPE